MNKSRYVQVLDGLAILMKYGENICAEHDIIYAGGEASAVSKEDAAELDALGWHIDESNDGYARFV